MVSVTDLHNLLNDYLGEKIDRGEFSRRFLSCFSSPEDMEDESSIGVSLAIHYSLAVALFGLRTEDDLREALRGIPIASYEVHIEDRSKSSAEPLPRFDRSRASSRDSSVELVFA